MKNKFLLTITVMILTSISCYEMPLPKKAAMIVRQLRADFRTSLNYVLQHEGYYSNHPRDAGGETYCGITRNFNPDWIGWETIDQYKIHHSLNWNDSIPLPYLQWKVNEYYLSIWVKEDFFSIKDQDVANYTLDFRINGTIGAAIIQRTLNEMNSEAVEVNNAIDSLTVKQLNRVPKWEFLCKLMNNRIDFYTRIVDKKQNQIVFLNHWVKRIKV